METPIIRTGNLNDVETIFDLHRRSILGLGRTSYTEAECKSWSAGLTPSQYENAMTHGGESYLVAEIEKTLVGFCSYKENEIIGLYVAPATSRRGVGTLLIRSAEADMATDPPVTITLNAALSASAFYRFHGYEETSARKWETRGGLEIDVCEMRKTVI